MNYCHTSRLNRIYGQGNHVFEEPVLLLAIIAMVGFGYGHSGNFGRFSVIKRRTYSGCIGFCGKQGSLYQNCCCMKLLLDANLSWRLIPVLKEYFDECVHADNIPDIEFPAKDTKIWQYAKDNGYIVITHDNDFNDLIFTRGFPPKIVWMRTGNCSRKITTDILIRSKPAIEELFISEEYGLLDFF